jgi:chemotaxis response regulator CheB
MVRILLADDHDVVRLGLRQLVEEQPGWEICAEATTGRQAVQLAKQHKPDVAVLDITMPELNGLDLTWVRSPISSTGIGYGTRDGRVAPRSVTLPWLVMSECIR